MKKILKNKKGMTLIELIVGMALFAIITTTVSAIFIPILKIYEEANELAECNTLLDDIANVIISDIANATTQLEIKGDNEVKVTIDISNIEYTVDSEGILLKNGTAVFSKTYYKKKSIKFICELDENGSVTAYTLTVSIISDKNEEIMLSRDYAIRPLALNQY